MSTKLSSLGGYTIFGFIMLIIYKVYTVLLFPKARLVRFPIYIKGKSQIDFGKGLTTGRFCRIECYGEASSIKFGLNCQLNDSVHIGCVSSISLEDNVLIASRVFIGDHNHGKYKSEGQSDPATPPIMRELSGDNIIIEKNVWIGEGVAVLPGVKIGYGSIIGANSVVTRNIPPETIVAGNPARIIKQYSAATKSWESIT